MTRIGHSDRWLEHAGRTAAKRDKRRGDGEGDKGQAEILPFLVWKFIALLMILGNGGRVWEVVFIRTGEETLGLNSVRSSSTSNATPVCKLRKHYVLNAIAVFSIWLVSVNQSRLCIFAKNTTVRSSLYPTSRLWNWCTVNVSQHCNILAYEPMIYPAHTARRLIMVPGHTATSSYPRRPCCWSE